MNIEKIIAAQFTTEELFALRDGISSFIENRNFLNDEELLIELEKNLTIVYQLAKGI